MVRKPVRLLLSLLFLLLCIVVPFATISAQEIIPIEYGAAVMSTVTAPDASVMYTFNGTIGDLVTIRAVGITPGADPTLSLVGPPQQVLAVNDNVLSLPPNPSAQIVFRLQATGPHFIVVGGVPGDFLLTLEGRPAAPLVILQPDAPVTITLPITETFQSFVFNTDPVFDTTIFLDSAPFPLDAYVELRDGTGQILSTLRSNLDNACLSVAPGDQLLELTIVAQPQITGTVTLTLSNAACTIGTTPVQGTPLPTPEFTPVAVEGVCAASSGRNVNIRSGPGTNYARLVLLQAGQPIQVTGQSDTGQWFVVKNEFIEGWISASVVGVSGPCAQLPVVAAPPLPAVTATPGFPVIVVQPAVVTATPGVVVITATPLPPQPVPTGTLPPPPPSYTPTLPPTAAPATATPTLTATVTPGS